MNETDKLKIDMADDIIDKFCVDVHEGDVLRIR